LIDKVKKWESKQFDYDNQLRNVVQLREKIDDEIGNKEKLLQEEEKNRKLLLQRENELLQSFNEEKKTSFG